MIRPRLTETQRRRVRRENALWFAAMIVVIVAFGLIAVFADRLS